MGFDHTGVRRWVFHLATLAIFAGLALSIVSWLEICTEECSETHKYRLFGLKFEYIGILFFTLLLGLHIASRYYPKVSTVALLLAASGLGAEVMFVLSQKYLIGSWCPICLSIAGCMAVAAVCYGIGYLQEFTNALNPFYKGEYMKIGWRGIASLSAFAMGFLFAFIGIAKTNELQAVQENVASQLWFGESSSPVEVYFFTDWACPACQKIEADIEDFLPEITKNAKFMFVDFAVHPETYNFAPFDISFMIHEKQNYLKLRSELSKLSKVTGSPTEQQVQEAIQETGVHFKGLNFADIALTTKYFKELGKKFDVDATPTMVIVNTKTKKGKKLEGLKEITTPNIIRSINSIK